MVMETMQGKLASSQFDFGYNEQFCIPGVTSLFFSSCDSLVRAEATLSLGSRAFGCTGPVVGTCGLLEFGLGSCVPWA